MLGSAISGLATGTLLGLLGGGGSIIAVPILVYGVGLEAKAAIGTSLLIVGLASLLAAWSHYRKQAMVVPTALIFGATGGLGSFAGSRLAQLIPDVVQLILLAVVMALVALLMLRHKQPAIPAGGDDTKISLPVVLASGFGAGLLTGLIGVGGGFIIVPALTILLRMPIRKAIGTSLLIIGINSMVGALSYASKLSMNLSILPFAISTLAAAPVAGRLAHFIPQEKLKFSFAISLLVLSAWMLTKQVFH
ncbi:MAG: sulfite exporter TauE/SafE family protein [Candidatus Obscuribacterales bacterium]|nr:sulfite exporter TauE/SafE family protein [Candidatus Obscuribacterales bacterium]